MFTSWKVCSPHRTSKSHPSWLVGLPCNRIQKKINYIFPKATKTLICFFTSLPSKKDKLLRVILQRGKPWMLIMCSPMDQHPNFNLFWMQTHPKNYLANPTKPQVEMLSMKGAFLLSTLCHATYIIVYSLGPIVHLAYYSCILPR